MSILDSIKHAVMVEDEPKQGPSVSHEPPTSPFGTTIHSDPSASSSIPQYNSPFSVPNTTTLDENVYKKVFDKTNFDTTTVGQIIKKYFDALDDSGLNTSARFKAAMKQAGKLDGITPDKVLAAFDDIKHTLVVESQKFDAAAAGIQATEITSRQNKLDQIRTQRAQLDQQEEQVTAELAKAQASHSNATQQFSMATQRRSTEIDQQREQFASLLQH